MTELPATFGKYFLTEKLATGGMAQLYLAKLIGPGGFEKRLVIKQIHPELSGKSQFVQMFVAEAKTLVSLSHGNIVPVYELGVVDDTYFIAMEYIDGPPLAQLVSAHRKAEAELPTTVAAYICAELLKGLDYAHRKGEGVVHRDLSPRNVLISRDGEVKLVDFGIAVTVENQAHGGEGQPTGSFPYMSPEQVRHESLTGQSDLFSAGVLLWEMLTGQRLFARDSAEETLEAVMSAPIPAPSSIRADVPAVMDEICSRALSRDPEHRYASAGSFLTALNRHLYSVEAPVTPQHLSALVARHCPPVARRAETGPLEDSDVSETPVGDATAVVERTRPLPARARGKRQRAGTKTFATNVHFEGVLAKATPLLSFDAIVDEVTPRAAPDATDEATATVPPRTDTEASEADSGERDDDTAAGASETPATTTPARRPRLVAAILASVMVLGAGTAVVLTRGGGDAGSSSTVADAGPTPTSDARARAAVPIDAAPIADARIDARQVLSRPADARRRRSRRPDAAVRRPQAKGILKVGANPWGDVYVDGKRLGRAPGAWPVPVGRRKVVVSFPVSGREQKRTFSVDITEGATKFVGIVDFTGD